MRTSSDNGDLALTTPVGAANSGANGQLAVSAISAAAASEPDEPSIVLIEQRIFARDCLARCLRTATGQNVVSYASVEDWLEDAEAVTSSLVVMCIPGDLKGPAAQRELALLPSVAQRLPTVVLSDFDDVDHVVDVLSRGAQGCIPTSLPFDVAIEALRSVKAGGGFVPGGRVI